MTDREKAIVMAHTGFCMLTGDKFQIFHEYIEHIMGRPVYTHELAYKAIENEIKEKSKADFIALCREQEPVIDKVKEVVDKWKADDFIGSDGFAWDCMKEIADIVDKAESEG